MQKRKNYIRRWVYAAVLGGFFGGICATRIGIVRAEDVGSSSPSPATMAARVEAGPAFRPDFAKVETLISAGKDAEAAAAYREILKNEPSNADAMGRLAELLAISKDNAVRDVAEAVKLIEQACRITQFKEPQHIASLAQIYAVNMQFDRAIKAGEIFLLFAKNSGDAEAEHLAEVRLEVYRSYLLHQQLEKKGVKFETYEAVKAASQASPSKGISTTFPSIQQREWEIYVFPQILFELPREFPGG